MRNIFTIRKTFYKNKTREDLSKDFFLFISENSMNVDYCCNGLPVVRQFLLPFNKVYHMLDSEFSQEVMRKEENWINEDIYVFLSFTIRDNIIKLNLPYKKSQGSEKVRDDLEYIGLFSITYELGLENVFKMYRCFINIINEYKLNVGKIAYIKVHRLTNSLDNVNLVDYCKFKKKLLSRKNLKKKNKL